MGGSTEEKTEDKPAAKASVPSKAEDKLFFDAVAKKTTKVSGLKQFWRRLITGDPNKRVRDKFFPPKVLMLAESPPGLISTPIIVLIGLFVGGGIASAVVRLHAKS